MTNDVHGSLAPVAVQPPPPEPADEKAPPVLGPLLALLGSQKAMVLILVVTGTLILVGLGRITWDQCKEFLMVIVPGWMLSHGIQDGLAARAKGGT